MRSDWQRRYPVWAILLTALAVTLAACGRSPWSSVIEDVQTRGTLRVATINAPTTFFEGREGLSGFDHDLAVAYAAHLGVEAQFHVYPSPGDALAALDRGEADIAAAGLIVTPERESQRRFSPAYRSIEEVIVCQRGAISRAARQNIRAAPLTVSTQGGHVRRLEALEQGGVFFTWSETQHRRGFEMLAGVADGDFACTLADSHVYALNRRYFSGLERVGTLPGRRRVAWALAGKQGPAGRDLALDLDDWFARRDTQALLEALDEQYFGFRPEEVDHRHAETFLAAIDRSLDDWEELFKEAGAEHDVPWTLLAAVAYQESHWNPRAVSPTGVRGMMMLTRPTARAMGVTNRVDARQSTFGGAKYLRRLRDRLPAAIEGDERWWFAAAAYNMGYGHLMDARGLARDRGLDPNSWADLRSVLHLLEDEEVYKDLRYGYGQGLQARKYVKRIRDFADILEKRLDSPVLVMTALPSPDLTQSASNGAPNVTSGPILRD